MNAPHKKIIYKETPWTDAKNIFPTWDKYWTIFNNYFLLLIQEVTWLDGVRPYNFPCSRVINNSWAMGNVFVQSVILYFRLDANFKIKDNTERNWHWRLKWELIKSKIRVYYVTFISLHDNRKGNGLYKTNGTNVLKDQWKILQTTSESNVNYESIKSWI